MWIRKWSPAIPLLLAIAGVGFWLAVKLGIVETSTVTIAYPVWADAGEYTPDSPDLALRG